MKDSEDEETDVDVENEEFSKEINFKSKLDYKLNYKHQQLNSSKCGVKCAQRYLNADILKCSKPYPICFDAKGKLSADSYLILPQLKQEFRNNIEMIRCNYYKNHKRLKVEKQYKCYETMQKVLNQDPDKYFNSNYNWYYTGGNFILHQMNDNNFIFYVKNNSELKCAKLKIKNNYWTCRKKHDVNKHNSDIFQLEIQTKNLKTFLGIRQKNHIIFYDIQTDSHNEIEYKLVNEQNSETPFAGLSLNSNECEKYVTVNTDQVIQIWDRSNLKPLSEYKIPHSADLEGDYFAQVFYSNQNVLSCLNRTNFCLVDKRVNDLFLSLSIDCKSILKSMDRFINVCPTNENLFNISTFRQLLLIDIRKKSVIHQYSHSFTSAPYISDLITINDNSLFCVSSCKPKEKLIIKQKDNTYLLPFSLPTINESFEESLLRNPNMIMSSTIKDRLSASVTGLQFCKYNNSVSLLSANILGDVYCHDLFKSDDDEHSNKRFLKWNQHLLDNRNITDKLEFVDKVVLNEIKFNYNQEPENLTSLIKGKRLQDCLFDLKKKTRGYHTKINDIWYDVTDATYLDHIEEIAPEANVRNWLSNFCLDKVED